MMVLAQSVRLPGVSAGLGVDRVHVTRHLIPEETIHAD